MLHKGVSDVFGRLPCLMANDSRFRSKAFDVDPEFTMGEFVRRAFTKSSWLNSSE